MTSDDFHIADIGSRLQQITDERSVSVSVPKSKSAIFPLTRNVELFRHGYRRKVARLSTIIFDEAQSGRTADRPEFINMRRDGKKKKFDAVVVHKFDRFSRNRTDALAIKSLLRHDYGIKAFSVTEPSEDSDGPIGALIEGIMESIADWYSRNLAQETVKGKRERALQGFHNNQAPFGMDKSKDGVLIPNDHEVKGLLLAFELYASSKYSDNDVARELNEHGYRTKAGKLFSTDMVRDMLQNRTYFGYVKYQPFQSHSDGRRSFAGKIEWYWRWVS